MEFFTNGGARSDGWWAHLGAVLGDSGRVIFAVDGLEETNAIYRRNVDFERVMRNARAFIEAGGRAQWDFIAFAHNEHEVERAREMSEDLGFEAFSMKKTARFLKPAYDYVPECDGATDLKQFPIYAEDGALVGALRPPRNQAFVNDTARRYEDLLTAHGNLDAVFSSTSIQCQVLRSGSIFVGASGVVFPCCWTYVQATTPVLHEFAPGSGTQLYDLVVAAGGFEAIDAQRVGIRSVVEGPLFEAIEASWSCSSVSDGRLQVCARVCGESFPAYFDQFASPDFVPGGVAR